MIVLILNKILMVIFLLSSLNTLREMILFAIHILSEGTDVKYKLSKKGLLELGLSIAIVLTAILTGISI